MNDDTFDSAQQMFLQQDLPMPPVPPALAAALAPQSRYLFATRALTVPSAYGIGAYVDEVLEQAQLQDYALVGFDGHGINSWAVHYYLVQGPLALFIQLPWGGAYLDAQPAAAEIARLFDWAAVVQHKAAQCEQAGKVAKGWRLAVVASRFIEAGWGWMAPVGQRAQPIAWRPGAQMLKNIDDHLSAILAGAAAPG